MTSYALIVNPASGRGRSLRKAEALQSLLQEDASVEFLPTARRGDATELARAAAGRVDRVVAVGGDGTLSEVLCGLMTVDPTVGRLPELGFLAAGTANVAVRAFGLGTDPVAVGRALPRAESTALDVGVARWEGGERAFLLWFGAGLDAVVIRTLNASRTGLMGVSGLVAHTPRVFRALAAYNRPPIEVAVDGEPFGAHASVVVANVGDMAFGGSVAEGADPADGRLDVVGIPRASLLGSVPLVLRLMMSSLTRGKGVRHALASEMSFRSDGAVPFQLDGEPVGMLPAAVRVMPGAVRLLRT